MQMIDISWPVFLSTYAILSGAYYLVIGWIHFRKDIFVRVKENHAAQHLTAKGPDEKPSSLYPLAIQASEAIKRTIEIGQSERKSRADILSAVKETLRAYAGLQGSPLEDRVVESANHYMLSLTRSALSDQEIIDLKNY